MNTAVWEVWESRCKAFLQRGGAQADAAHDLEHTRRVVANARRLALAEGADLAVVLPAAWLHDCVIVPKHAPQRAQASRMAAQAAIAFLRAEGYPRQYLPGIAHAIKAHSFSAGIVPRTPEACVVQDADRLDALGAIGVARCLMLGAAAGRPLYHPEDPFLASRLANDSHYTIDHFFEKLLHLAGSMATTAGREEALQRTRFIEQFLDQLAHELGVPWRTHS